MGLALALAVKADLFEMMTHLEAPGDTLGWVTVQDGAWVRSHASSTVGTAMYAAGGSLITGFALGLGSKFWHEVLDMALEIRRYTKALKNKAEVASTEVSNG